MAFVLPLAGVSLLPYSASFYHVSHGEVAVSGAFRYVWWLCHRRDFLAVFSECPQDTTQKSHVFPTASNRTSAQGWLHVLKSVGLEVPQPCVGIAFHPR